MVADLKYNTKQGVKICEIQQGCLSLFNGDKFRAPEEASIHKQLLDVLASYNQNGWIVANSIIDKNLVSALTSSSLWQSPKDLVALLSDHDFLNQSAQPVADRHDLSSYQGFLYVNFSMLRTIPDFAQRFAGMIIIDKASFPFWIDKYKMTQLFAEDELLATCKPKWGHYKKIYTPELASQIACDLQCDTFVIKPRGEFLGKGVIIAKKEELDEILSYIITKSGRLADSQDPVYQDPAYTAWKYDSFDSFIVEEFVTSDPVTLPHLENKVYQPTMRVAFVLVYNKGCHEVHFLGGYWKTPSVSLHEEGSFMDKNKDICEPPYYCPVDAATMQAVQEQLRIALPLLHSKMLQFCAKSPDECYAPPKKVKWEVIFKDASKNTL